MELFSKSIIIRIEYLLLILIIDMKFILRNIIKKRKKLLILIMMFEKRHIQSESYLITMTYE